MLRAMKDATIARPHPDDPGLERQYAKVAPGEQPRCLANMPTTVAGQRFVVLPEVVEVFVDTFVRLLDVVTVAGDPEEEPPMAAEEVFEVPDMACSHCTNAVAGVLESYGASVTEIDLDSKKVIAAFPSDDVGERAFDAIREQGYTVVRPSRPDARPAVFQLWSGDARCVVGVFDGGYAVGYVREDLVALLDAVYEGLSGIGEGGVVGQLQEDEVVQLRDLVRE